MKTLLLGATLVLSALLAGGFGLCAGWGLFWAVREWFVSSGSGESSAILWLFSVPGALVAWGCFVSARRAWHALVASRAAPPEV